MNQTIFFALCFVAGTVMAVFAMFIGVVRPPGGNIPEIPAGTGPFVSRERLIAAASRLSARYNLPVFAAFLFAAGLVGYALSRFTQLGALAQLAVAGVAGGGLAAFTATMVAKWALPRARRDIPDERFLLQGQFARVLREVRSERGGVVTLDINGEKHDAPAVSLMGDSIAPGTEVVIDRIEDEVAFVEPWETVEKRI